MSQQTPKEPDPQSMTPPMTKKEIKHHLDVHWWNDARAVLALVAVIGAFSLQGVMIVNDVLTDHAGTTPSEVRSIPTWTAATVSAIVGFYFGARGGGNGGSNGNGNGH